MSGPGRGGRPRGGAVRAWTALAVFVLNTTLALLAANLGCAALFRAGILLDPAASAPAASTPPASAAYDAAVGAAVARGTYRARGPLFPGRSARDVAALTLESRAFRPLVYAPFVQLSEGPYAGRFVSVHLAGFRGGARPLPWPPEAAAGNVLVFGGSTMFGDGLPDAETVPARLERLLRGVPCLDCPFRVYNFGCADAFSTQERVRFETALLAGAAPVAAVFVDGPGEFEHPADEPAFTERFRALMARAGGASRPALRDALTALPLGRAAAAVRAAADPATSALDAASRPRAAADVERVVGRYLENRRQIETIARAVGARALFVWQPPFDDRLDAADAAVVRAGYGQVAALARAGRLGPDFVWCADAVPGGDRPPTMDGVHYTPRTAEAVARCIARALARRIRRP